MSTQTTDAKARITPEYTQKIMKLQASQSQIQEISTGFLSEMVLDCFEVLKSTLALSEAFLAVQSDIQADICQQNCKNLSLELNLLFLNHFGWICVRFSESLRNLISLYGGTGVTLICFKLL